MQQEGQQGLAYIRISTFSKATAQGVRSAIQQLQAQGASRCLPQVGLDTTSHHILNPDVVSGLRTRGSCTHRACAGAVPRWI